MHQSRFRRICVAQDPNSELEKHPMSLEASQSSRESTRYPRDSKPLPGGGLPRTGFYVSRIPSGFSRRLRGFEAHRMLFELRNRIQSQDRLSSIVIFGKSAKIGPDTSELACMCPWGIGVNRQSRTFNFDMCVVLF